MATLSFATTDRKVFTPISQPLANLPNGAGTIVVLIKKSVLGATDYCGLTNAFPDVWYHALMQQTTDQLQDDDGLAAIGSSSNPTDDTSNWWFYAVDWPAGGAALERFHWRNQTTLGSWTHANSGGNNGGNRAGPGTSGWLRVGYHNDNSTATKAMAVAAVWAGVRFADADYMDFRRSSELFSHPRGHPTFMTELNSTTPSDLTGNAAYSSGNSTGTALTGADPDNFALDGAGAVGTSLHYPFSY